MFVQNWGCHQKLSMGIYWGWPQAVFWTASVWYYTQTQLSDIKQGMEHQNISTVLIISLLFQVCIVFAVNPYISESGYRVSHSSLPHCSPETRTETICRSRSWRSSEDAARSILWRQKTVYLRQLPPVLLETVGRVQEEQAGRWFLRWWRNLIIHGSENANVFKETTTVKLPKIQKCMKVDVVDHW